MDFTVSEIVAAVGGRLVPGTCSAAADRRTALRGASIDSRALQPGQLFVPIVAERDGHDFIPAAVAAGAPAYLTARREGPHAKAQAPAPTAAVAVAVAIEVADTQVALAELALAARARIPGGVIAVTGSVGKTSVKDMTAAAVRSTLVATAAEKSFNNELGVPLTLVNGPDASQAAVIEMGSRGIGHIAQLCAIARPTVGVVTRVAPAHLELFGSIEEVARGKGELVEALPANGTAVLNAADPNVAAMAQRTAASVVTFGEGGEVRAEGVVLDERARPTFTVRSPWGAATVALPLSGAHMVANALAAVAAAASIGVELAAAADALATMRPTAWRMEVASSPRGTVIVNDAYNASPLAIEAAFDAIGAMSRPGAVRVALLGPMAELGEGSEAAHRSIAESARRRSIRLVAVATDAYGPGVAVVPDHDAAAEVVASLGCGDVVLVKASRVAGLERLAQRLVAGA